MTEMVLVHVNPRTLQPTKFEIDRSVSPIQTFITEGPYTNCALVPLSDDIVRVISRS